MAKRDRPSKSNVGSLTGSVNEANRQKAAEALVAADFYATCLLRGLNEISLSLHGERPQDAFDPLSGVLNGIRCLADILAAVSRATGIDTPATTDQELGRVALAVQRVSKAMERKDLSELSTLVDYELSVSLGRLAPSFAAFEDRLALSA